MIQKRANDTERWRFTGLLGVDMCFQCSNCTTLHRLLTVKISIPRSFLIYAQQTQHSSFMLNVQEWKMLLGAQCGVLYILASPSSLFVICLRWFCFCRKEKESSEDKSEPFARQVLHADPVKPFLQALAESKVEDETALKFLAAVDRFCKQKRFVLPIEFPADHPVEKVGRMLMACLLKHQELGMAAYSVSELDYLHHLQYVDRLD